MLIVVESVAPTLYMVYLVLRAIAFVEQNILLIPRNLSSCNDYFSMIIESVIVVCNHTGD